MNIYDIANEELKRMNEERDRWMTVMLQAERNHDSRPDMWGRMAHTRYKELDEEISKIRSKIFNCLEKYDEVIQEKVAELALTSK